MLRYFFQIILASICVGSVCGYSSSGRWERGTEYECVSHHLCTPDTHLTWRSEALVKIFDNKTACDLLQERNYREIHLFGDSLTRHLSQALLLVFSGDYDGGALRNKLYATFCTGDRQFAERACSDRYAVKGGLVCDGKIRVEYHDYRKKTQDIVLPSNSLFLWNEGSHPAYFNYTTKYGANDPKAYQEKFLTYYDICQRDNSNVLWVSTHQRPAERDVYETFARIEEYNRGMRDFFSSGACGKVGYVDVWNMTHVLGKDHPASVKKMSYDTQHFARTINLLKAQLVLNYILVNNLRYKE